MLRAVRAIGLLQNAISDLTSMAKPKGAIGWLRFSWLADSPFLFPKKGVGKMDGHYLTKEIHSAGLFRWEIARHLGIGESRFNRMLEIDVSDYYTEVIRAAIEDLREDSEPPP